MGVQSCISRISHLWDRFQVELHGQFSLDKVEQIRDYVLHRSRSHSLLQGVFTPLPALVAMIITDCIPLVSPDEGTSRNYAFWIRMSIAVIMMLGGLFDHFRCCVPNLRMSNWELIYATLCATTAGVAFGFAASLVIGFPVPFLILVGSMTALPTMVFLAARLWRPILRGNAVLQHHLRQQIWVLVGQFALIFVYPLYLFAFVPMGAMGQHIFILVLTVIKITLKNYFSRMLHQLHDCKPAFIVFNADLFNALYVANSLQTSQSLVNTLVVMLVDIAQMAVSMFDVHAVMREIRQLAPLDQCSGSLLDICVETTRSSKVCSEVKTIHPVDYHISKRSVAPAPSPRPPTTTDLSQDPPSHETRLVSNISKVLYMAEFILLIEFVEVIIPVVYGSYLGAMSYLPNRVFYPRLATLNPDELAHSISIVMLNAGLEFVSFLAACWLLQRQLRLSSLHLMGFALQSQRSLTQSSLMIWTLHVTQQAVVHSGVDFTMKFTWLRAKSK